MAAPERFFKPGPAIFPQIAEIIQADAWLVV